MQLQKQHRESDLSKIVEQEMPPSYLPTAIVIWQPAMDKSASVGALRTRKEVAKPQQSPRPRRVVLRSLAYAQVESSPTLVLATNLRQHHHLPVDSHEVLFDFGFVTSNICQGTQEEPRVPMHWITGADLDSRLDQTE